MITILKDSTFELTINVSKGTTPVLYAGNFALEVVFPDRTKKILTDNFVDFTTSTINTDLVDGEFILVVPNTYTSSNGIYRINILSDEGTTDNDLTSGKFTQLGTFLYKVVTADTAGSVRV